MTGERGLDGRQMNYKYEWFDYTAAALRRNRLDPAERERNTDIQPDPNAVVMISKDTAYLDTDGRPVNQTITRPLSSREVCAEHITPVDAHFLDSSRDLFP